MGHYSTRIRKILAATATVAVISATAPTASAFTFKDVSVKYELAVDYLVKENITNGLSESSFGITQQIKRADAAVMIARALNLVGEEAPDAGFNDVPVRAQSAVDILKNHGIINGKTSTSFGSNDTLTRGEMAIIIARAYQLKGDAEMPFTDVNSRYMEYVKALIANGITQGKTDTLFGTDEQITRGEFALFIYRSESPYNPVLIKVIQPDDIKARTYMDVSLPTTVNLLMRGNNLEEKMVGWEMVDFSAPGEHIIHGEIFGTDLTTSLRIIIETTPEDVNAQKADEIIASLPATITLDDEEKIKEARMLVDEVLQRGSEDMIKGLATLEKAEDTIKLLYAIKDAEEVIALLPETITLTDQKAVEAAREKVNKVYGMNTEAVISTIQKLEKAEHTILLLSLTNEAEDAIESIPSPVTLDAVEQIATARTKVDEVLKVDANAVIKGIDILQKAESDIGLLKAQRQAEELIAALPDPITLGNRSEVQEARKLVDAGLQLDKNMTIEGLSKLEAAEVRIQELLIESAEVNLSKSQLSMNTNKTYQLTASVTPSEVSDDLEMTWTSDNPTVATVDENGLVTSQAEGSAVITVQLENGQSAESVIEVTDRPQLQFSHGSSQVNNVIKSLNMSFYNYSSNNVIVKKVEIYEGDTQKSQYTESELNDAGIDTDIGSYERFSLGITYNFGGLLASNGVYVIYTVQSGQGTYEFKSIIK
ncbi:S-layer homology domain-containing protein [Rossellomorea sp. YZS02]|uniref:S-layer homology domain-containing protein n=1 Tax=Rossellomorea sp. YZS02 TaxID=3097358 RepID=UPI002A0CB49D|nr:S-layer homology domain-containing protein [Rossellomorea sp. YZS02]MDX8346149.1 S-layer homology domain-containing protein [Rossellomorea sp. YZS02]